MKINVDRKPENCNHCIYRENVGRYFDLDDYCSKNMKHIRKINMETDCPLRKDKDIWIGRKIALNVNLWRNMIYGKEIYYCDHTDRIDDMGKLGEENLPETSPVWCPVSEKG